MPVAFFSPRRLDRVASSPSRQMRIGQMMNGANRGEDGVRIRVRRGAVGVLERGLSLLLIKRAPGLARAGLWCFPGGHIETGETSRRAVRRELAEEIGIQVTPVERLGAVRLATIGYVLAVWRVSYAGVHFIPAPDEVAEIRWFTPQQIRSLKDGMASNDRVLELLGV